MLENYIGSKEVDKYYLGEDKVYKLYKGTELI